MLLAEDLLLLLLDDESGTPQWGLSIDTVLGGALLSELALEDFARLGEKDGFWNSAKVFPNPATAPEDPLLAAGVRIIAEKERSANALVTKLGKGLREQLNERLASAEILQRGEQRVLGIFPRTVWPAVDVAHEREVRQALTAALVQGASPAPRTAALIALLHSVGHAHKVVPADGASTRDIKRRAKQLAEGDWAAKAVYDVIAAQTAAAT